MRRPVVAIHQPNFLPWLGFVAKAARADVFVLLDDVQLERGGATRRVRIKARQGDGLLSVPVKRGRGTATRIDEAEIAQDGKWDVHAAHVLENAYGGTPGWPRFGATFVELLRCGEPRLAWFNERLVGALFDAFAVAPRIVRASELGPRDAGANAGNLELCRRLGAGTYLSGSGGRRYNEPETYEAAGIDLVYSGFEHPRYAQPHGAFVEGLSSVDLLFSAPDDARALLTASLR